MGIGIFVIFFKARVTSFLKKGIGLISLCMERVIVPTLLFNILPVPGSTFYQFFIQSVQVCGSTRVPNVGTKFHHVMVVIFLAPCFVEILNQIFNSVILISDLSYLVLIIIGHINFEAYKFEFCTF